MQPREESLTGNNWPLRILRVSLGLKPPLKLLVTVLLSYEHPATGLAWPSVKRLAKDAELNPRQVKRYLKQLRDLGVIKLSRPGGGRKRTARYSLEPLKEAIVKAESGQRVIWKAESGKRFTTKGCQSVTFSVVGETKKTACKQVTTKGCQSVTLSPTEEKGDISGTKRVTPGHPRPLKRILVGKVPLEKERDFDTEAAATEITIERERVEPSDADSQAAGSTASPPTTTKKEREPEDEGAEKLRLLFSEAGYKQPTYAAIDYARAQLGGNQDRLWDMCLRLLVIHEGQVIKNINRVLITWAEREYDDEDYEDEDDEDDYTPREPEDQEPEDIAAVYQTWSDEQRKRPAEPPPPEPPPPPPEPAFYREHPEQDGKVLVELLTEDGETIERLSGQVPAGGVWKVIQEYKRHGLKPWVES